MSDLPRLTLFTPCYNSVRFIHRVWDSVQAQTVRDFEWIVVDDGSRDGTVAWFEERADRCVVPLRLIAKTRNEGVSASFRTVTAAAKAPYLLPIGHDDSFVSHAVETFLRHWDAIPEDKWPLVAGVAARCMHEDGRPLDAPVGRPYIDVTPAEAYFVHGRRHEKWKCMRTDLVRAHLAPSEIDAFVPEGFMWRTIGATHLVRYVDDILRTYYRDNPDSIMNSPRLRWPRGRAFALAVRMNLEWRYRPLDPAHFRASMAAYARYCLDAGLTPLQAARHLHEPAARRLFWSCLPMASLAALNDRRKGRLDPARSRGDWSDPRT